MAATNLIEGTHDAEGIELLAVDGDAVALAELEFSVLGLVRSVFWGDREFEHGLVRRVESVHPRVLEDTSLERNVQEVAVGGVRLLGAGFDRDLVISAISDHLGATGEVLTEGFIAPRGDDFEIRGESRAGELKANLVVTLAGGAVSDGGGAFLASDLDHAFSDERARDGGAEVILAFVDGASLHHREDEVAGEFGLKVVDVKLGGAGLHGLLLKALELVFLADVGAERDHLGVVLVLDPGKEDGGVEATGVGQDDFLLLAHVSGMEKSAAVRGEVREDGLLHVQTVLGLVEDDALLALEHFGGDFLARVGRETVHEIGAGLSQGHQLRIDLIGLHGAQALGLLGFHTHADPDVRVDHVGTLHGGGRVGRERESLWQAVLLQLGADLGARLVASRTRERDLNAEGGATEYERVGHIAGSITEEGDLLALERGGVLFRAARRVAFGEREHVRHELARMQEVGQRVDDRHRAAPGELLEQAMLVATDDHAVEVARKDARGIRDGLSARNLEIIGVEHHRLAAELMDADLERHAGTGALLEEHQAPRLVRKGNPSGLASGSLQRRSRGEDLGRFGRTQVGLL